jgi:uncharacterized protein
MRKGDYLITISGRKFWPMDPAVEDVDIHDIAWALSRICRFGGHVNTHYSVATHCTAISYLVPEEDALWALLHDASEAYVGDMVRPLKNSMEEYREAEERVISVIMRKFGLPDKMPESVHYADKMILEAEKFLFTNQPVPTDLDVDIQPYVDAIHKALLDHEQSPVSVYMRYLCRFKDLAKQPVLLKVS